jgi:hypothetical protein
MSKAATKNLPASIRRRLLNHAQAHGNDYQRVLTLCLVARLERLPRLERALTLPIHDGLSISCVRGFWALGAQGFVRLLHRLTSDTFANALEG